MVKNAAIAGQRKAAERLVKIVREHLNKQDLGWAERSSTTNSGDSRILVDYGEYYDAIKAWRKNDIYYAGVKNDAYNHRGIQISKYAAYHEYGTSTEPARPLWGPSMGDLGGSKGVRKIVIDSIYRKILELRNEGFDIEVNL